MGQIQQANDLSSQIPARRRLLSMINVIRPRTALLLLAAERPTPD
jgi:hypothetical protein